VTGCASSPVGTSTFPVVEDCLRHVPGQITETRGDGWRSGARYHFIPSQDPEPAAWVHLDDDTVKPIPPATHELISGAEVTALYWKDEPVAFETSHGRVVPSGADLNSRTNFLWGGLIGVCLGGICWFAAFLVRHRSEAARTIAAVRSGDAEYVMWTAPFSELRRVRRLGRGEVPTSTATTSGNRRAPSSSTSTDPAIPAPRSRIGP
jgi:hypothetical protein